MLLILIFTVFVFAYYAVRLLEGPEWNPLDVKKTKRELREEAWRAKQWKAAK